MQKLLFGIALALMAAKAQAAGLNIGNGAAVDFGNALVDLGCGDLIVDGNANTNAANISSLGNLTVAVGGTLTVGSGRIALGGDFANASTFTPGTGQVLIGDACSSGISHIAGANAFYDLTIASGAGKQIVFAAGLLQSVAHAFTLQGTAGNLLRVTSSMTGTKARLAIAAGAEQTVAYVDARDNDASGGSTIAPGAASSYRSVDGGGLVNWFGSLVGTHGGAAPAPALGTWAALLLAVLLATFAWKRSRAEQPPSASLLPFPK